MEKKTLKSLYLKNFILKMFKKLMSEKSTGLKNLNLIAALGKDITLAGEEILESM